MSDFADFASWELDSDTDDESYAPSESDNDTDERPYMRSERVDQTDDLRDALPEDDVEIANIVVNALEELEKLRLNLPLLLELVSWGNAACRSNLRIKSARMLLLKYSNLSNLLTKWCYPPPSDKGGKRPDGARVAMEDWAFTCVEKIVQREMDVVVAPILKSHKSQMEEEHLLGIDIDKIRFNIKRDAHRTWSLVRRLVYSVQQEKRNKQKNPDGVCTLEYISQV
jgi:hypothetical protein